jgi:hypothetical protein
MFGISPSADFEPQASHQKRQWGGLQKACAWLVWYGLIVIGFAFTHATELFASQ